MTTIRVHQGYNLGGGKYILVGDYDIHDPALAGKGVYLVERRYAKVIDGEFPPPAAEPVASEEGEPQTAAANLKKLKIDELKALAEANGIELPEGATKPQIIELLAAAES